MNQDSVFKIIGSSGVSASNFTITWSSVAGKVYVTSTKANLAEPLWNDLSEELTATGATMSWTDNRASAFPSQFYRVRWVG
jgi:hypothetical protein